MARLRLRALCASVVKIRAKQSQFGEEVSSLGFEVRGVKCKTKPIAAERTEMGAGRQGREAPGATDCAKRTQFGQPPRAAGGEMCKTKPIWRANRAKQTQFAPGRADEAAAGANRAKRSQFARAGLGRVKQSQSAVREPSATISH
jgi:hypothetical protein